MKKVLVSGLILFGLSLPTYSQDCPSVRIEQVGQKLCQQCGHLQEDLHQVRLRLVNHSPKPVIVYGFNSEDEFIPTGYRLTFDRDTCQWKYPGSENAPADWDAKSSMEKKPFMLQPDEFLEFDTGFDQGDLGKFFKRTVYVDSILSKNRTKSGLRKYWWLGQGLILPRLYQHLPVNRTAL